ncbi:MAG: hypothetical protein H0V16_09735 [Burkholderiaceae bacterium]|nr:hypothetical protein [Burkholderiaceae bacterium]
MRHHFKLLAIATALSWVTTASAQDALRGKRYYLDTARWSARASVASTAMLDCRLVCLGSGALPTIRRSSQTH